MSSLSSVANVKEVFQDLITWLCTWRGIQHDQTILIIASTNGVLISKLWSLFGVSYEVTLESLQNGFSVPLTHFGVFQSCFRVASESLCSCFEIALELLRSCFESLWSCFGVALELLWSWFWVAVELCWSHFGVAFKSLWSHLGVTWRSLPSKQKPFSWIYAANNVDIRWYKNLKLSGFQSKNNIIQFKKHLLFISYLKQCSNQCYPPKKIHSNLGHVQKRKQPHLSMKKKKIRRKSKNPLCHLCIFRKPKYFFASLWCRFVTASCHMILS